MNSDYRLVLKRGAIKFLAKQDKAVKERIARGMEGLLVIPPEGDIKTMKGIPGLYRLRVGTYRILFRIDQKGKVVYIDAVSNRGDVYEG